MNTWYEVEEPKPEAVTAMGWLRVGVRGNGFDRFGFWEFVGLSVGSPGRATRLWA